MIFLKKDKIMYIIQILHIILKEKFKNKTYFVIYEVLKLKNLSSYLSNIKPSIKNVFQSYLQPNRRA